MDVVSSGPFRVAALPWHTNVGVPVLTVVAKGTFLLEQGEAPLSPVQEPPNEEDNHWDDDPSRSLYSPSDLVPRKPRADVLLVGSAFAPRREPVRSLLVRLVVGEVDKSIEVFCDRWLTPDGQLREGPRFTKMPLRWERASSGPSASNPVGVRLDGPPDAHGNLAIPNLQPPGLYVTRRSDLIPAISYGPIAPSWPDRRDRLGRRRETWSDRAWADHPLPEDIDRAYFQTAPQNQQVDALSDNERIILENLHPEHARLVTSLPGLRPRAVVERPGAAAKEIEMRADTLWIDTDRSICTLTWHMQVRLTHRSEPGRITISMVHRGDSPPVEVPAAAASSENPLVKLDTSLKATQILPRSGDIPASEAQEDTARWSHGRGAHGEDIEEISLDMAIDDTHAFGGGDVKTVFLTPEAAGILGPVLPFQGRSRDDAEPRAKAAPLPPPPAEVAPPPLRVTMSPAEVMPPAFVRAPAVEQDPKPPPEREVIRLLWFDAAIVPRLRKQPKWRRILLESDRRPRAEGDEGAGDEEESDEAKARRHVFEVMTRGERLEMTGVREALTGATGKNGQFEPPLVMVAGEMVFPFDELETLKATVAAVSPLMAGDKKLKEVVDAVQDLLKTPWLEGAGLVAEGLTDRVKEAFAQGKRALPADYLTTHTERMLLQKRRYQRRTVFGGECIRSMLGMPGAEEGVVAYLPEQLGKELPMVQRMRCRVLAEVEGQQDQYEAGAMALKVVGLGRAMGRGFSP